MIHPRRRYWPGTAQERPTPPFPVDKTREPSGARPRIGDQRRGRSGASPASHRQPVVDTPVALVVGVGAIARIEQFAVQLDLLSQFFDRRARPSAVLGKSVSV